MERPKYEFDLTELIEKVPLAIEAKKKMEDQKLRETRKEVAMISADTINIEEYGFFTGTIVSILADRKTQYRDWMVYCLETPLLADMNEQARKAFASNTVTGLRNKQSMLENKIEVLLDFLGLDMILRDRATNKEER